MTRKNQIQRSGIRLQKQGALFVQQTRKAGETFVGESLNASVTFARDMRAAGTKLVTSLGRSTQGLQKALQTEALDWQALVVKTREAYLTSLKEQVDRAEQRAFATREALRPQSLQTTMLRSTRNLLVQAQSKVDEQLEHAAAPQRPTTAARPAAKPATAAKTPAKKLDVPLRNYDQLTAKDVVNRVQRLSAPQATAVLDYERASKKRATVIRAAEQRLAVAS